MDKLQMKRPQSKKQRTANMVFNKEWQMEFFKPFK
jgi:hypothetical protein